MKRFIATVLTVALALSMTMAVSATVSYHVSGIEDVPRKLDEDNCVSSTEASTDESDADRINYGDVVYFALISDATDGFVTESSAVSSTSIKKHWDEGSTYVASTEIVRKKDAGSGKYRYYLALGIKYNSTKSEHEIEGTISLVKSGSDGFDLDMDVYLTVGKPEVDAYDGMTLTDKDVIYTFYSGDDYTIYLGDSDVGYFEAEGSSQTIVLRCDTDYDEDITKQYPNANLDFVNGNGASFSRTGEMVIYAEKGDYLYSVDSDGALTKVTAKYDSGEDGFVFSTKTLGRYVISDTLLNVSSTSSSSSTASSSQSSSVTSSSANSWTAPTGAGAPTGGGGISTGVKQNPATGALSY